MVKIFRKSSSNDPRVTTTTMIRSHRVIVFVDDGDDTNARPTTILTFYPETGIFGFDGKLFKTKHTTTNASIVTALIRTKQPPAGVSPILWVEYMAVQGSCNHDSWCLRLVALIGGFDLLSSLILASADRRLRQIQRWWVRRRPLIRYGVRMLVRASRLNEDCAQRVLEACWRRGEGLLIDNTADGYKTYAFSWTDIEVTCTVLLYCIGETVTDAHWWMLDGIPNTRYSTSDTGSIPWIAKAYKCAKRLTVHQQKTSSPLNCTVVTFLHFFLRSDTTIICTEWRRQILVIPNEMRRSPSSAYRYGVKRVRDFRLIDRAVTAVLAVDQLTTS